MESQTELCEVAKEYFDDLFTGDIGNMQHILYMVGPRITQLDNDLLLAPFTMEEFQRALFCMHLDKAPGPDGLNLAFYKRFWHLCGAEIFHTRVLWLSTGEVPKKLVETNIVLIPKKDSPETLRDLRPISLCNVL